MTRSLRPYKPVVHIPSEQVPLILALGVAAWLAFAGVGYGFWLLLMALERVAA